MKYCLQFGLLELEQPQHEGISLDVKSDPICSYLSRMFGEDESDQDQSEEANK